MTKKMAKGERFVEAKVYLSHVRALFAPGSKARQHTAMPTEVATPGDLTDWTDDELKLLVEECRFTLADQSARFDQVRTTSQILLPLAFGLVAIFGTQLGRVVDLDSRCTRVALALLWIVGCLCSVIAGLGAAAILSVRAQFGRVLPTLLSKEQRPILQALAAGYAGQTAVGETTVATRLTIVRDAVFLLTAGGCIELFVWIFLNVWA